MAEEKHYVGIEAVQPFETVLGEIGRMQEELWNSHIRPERLVLSSEAYGRLMRELGQPDALDAGRGGASVARDRPSAVRGLQIGHNPLTDKEIRLEGVPFRY